MREVQWTSQSVRRIGSHTVLHDHFSIYSWQAQATTAKTRAFCRPFFAWWAVDFRGGEIMEVNTRCCEWEGSLLHMRTTASGKRCHCHSSRKLTSPSPFFHRQRYRSNSGSFAIVWPVCKSHSGLSQGKGHLCRNVMGNVKTACNQDRVKRDNQFNNYLALTWN